MCNIILAAGHKVGFTKAYVSISYLHTGNTMALILMIVDKFTILLVGRGQSDLHTATKRFTRVLDARIVQYITYAFILPVLEKLYCIIVPLRPSSVSPQGSQGVWYRIGVASEI